MKINKLIAVVSPTVEVDVQLPFYYTLKNSAVRVYGADRSIRCDIIHNIGDWYSVQTESAFTELPVDAVIVDRESWDAMVDKVITYLEK